MTFQSKSLLITCPRVVDRTGLEVYVTDIAKGLEKRGWQITIFAPAIGPHADSIVSPSIKFVTHIEEADRPDLIHGNFYFETISACLRFPKTPLIFQSHSATIWQASPPKIPNLRKVLSVSAACNRVLELEVGLATSQNERTYNFVDTDLFEARKTKLPDRPLRALVFSNYASELNYLPAVRAACEAEGIALDAVGQSVGAPTAHPERILGNYDLVFARGRAAIEAMAAGCAVILCDHEGMGVMVTADNFEYLRHWNFGYHVLNNQHSTEFIRSQIMEYDSAGATAVSHLVRSGSSLSGALDVLEEHYEQVLTDCAPPPGMSPISFDYSDLINDVSARMASDHDPSRVYDPLYRAYLLGLYMLKTETGRLAKSTFKQPFLKRLIGKWLSGP